MMKFTVENKAIVVPGEVLAEGSGSIAGDVYKDGDFLRAARLGLLNTDNKALIALSGRYNPQKGDTIIGKVVDVNLYGWRLEINCAYTAMLSMKEATSEFIAKGADLTQYFDLGDYIVVKIYNVTTQKLVDVTSKGPGLKKIKGGRIIEVNTHKVPRIIGKQGSMVGMIKFATNCKISVGQNGLVWISGEPEKELIAVETIRRIERESHLSGLTDTIKQFLEEKTGVKIEERAEEKAEEFKEFRAN